jgi:hypothetical protein
VLARCQERESSRRKARDDSEARLVAANQVLTACRDVIRSMDAKQLAPILLTRARRRRRARPPWISPVSARRS